MRFNIIETESQKRRCRLKYLEHKCCLIAFLNLTENKLKAWTVKYGRLQDVMILLEKYNNFVIGNNIFQEFNKAFIDMKNVFQEYKQECHIDYKETIAVEKFLKQTAEQWKNIAMELRCAHSMLEEVVLYWKRWKVLSDELKAWLQVSMTKINLSNEEQIEYFQNIGVWKEKYELLNDAVSFLVVTCEESTAESLKQEFMNISHLWDSVFSNAKNYLQSGDLNRIRKEYFEGFEILHKWIIRADQIMSTVNLNSSEKIKVGIKNIQTLQDELGQMDDLFKAISKKFQILIKDLSREEVNDMMLCLKREKESLVNIRANIPVQLNALHHVLVQYDALESGQREINEWLDGCENFIFSLNISVSKEKLQSDLENLK
ncbi:muscle-specific protein 300 kDa-like, partial [Daktulosphaira vitifoliae]|uniref:muscle-specific protein 300 kDa-like n=1 Tax=Daktulosphaira vitifoliae TaxID=58002 RepID=UPI0021AAABAD